MNVIDRVVDAGAWARALLGGVGGEEVSDLVTRWLGWRRLRVAMMDLRSDEAVYRSHAAELVQFAVGLVGRADAPDVVADAFIRVTGSKSWGRAIDRRALWYRAVVFEAASWQRSAVRRRAREQIAVVARPASVDQYPSSEIEFALDALSAQQRAVVVLAYWADLTPNGVAELLGLSEGAVRKQLARARRKLKGVLSYE